MRVYFLSSNRKDTHQMRAHGLMDTSTSRGHSSASLTVRRRMPEVSAADAQRSFWIGES